MRQKLFGAVVSVAAVVLLAFLWVQSRETAAVPEEYREQTLTYENGDYVYRYEPEEIARLALSDISYGDFFRRAPAMHPNRTLITGKVCGVRVEEIEDPLLREIRRLDKLVDELAAGKSLDRIRR